jgi:predicted transcriptional regulator
VKYRSRTDVIADILKAIIVHDGKCRVTRLLYSAETSYEQLREYLEVMEDNDLIRKTPDGWEITKKGHEFLDCVENLNSMLKVKKAKKTVTPESVTTNSKALFHSVFPEDEA